MKMKKISIKKKISKNKERNKEKNKIMKIYQII